MKTLKFRENLAKQILNGKKIITWRLFDDKNLKRGDIISLLIFETEEEFARARLIDVKEKAFAELEDKDWKGHEKFNSEEEMYKTYSKYYKKEITPKTKLKIIKFELIK